MASECTLSDGRSVARLMSGVACCRGPNEHDLALAGDTIVAVIRLDAGDGHAPPSVFARVESSNRGRTWSAPSLLADGIGSARPRLAQMGSHLLLSGGRNPQHGKATSEMSVWVAADAAGSSTWRQYSVTAAHNRLAPAGTVHFTDQVNLTSAHRQITGYSSLFRVEKDVAVLLYDVADPRVDQRRCRKPLGSDVCADMYAMRVRVL